MIVLGIDPGTAALGYGIIDQTASKLRAVDFGCLTTTPDRSLPERLDAIHRFVRDLIVLHEPDLVGVERLFFSRNAQTAFAVGQARGVVLLAAAQAGLPVVEATPNEVKLAIAGDGAADKTGVQRMLQLVLELASPPTPDDAADALAIAVWAAGAGSRQNALGSNMMDRAAIAPITTGTTPYERAVRAAIAQERRARP